MLRKNWNPNLRSESGTEIADCGFLIFNEKPADSGFGLPSLILRYLFHVKNVCKISKIN